MSKDKEMKIIVNEPVVVAIHNGKKGSARCCPEDTFDLSVGIKLAVERLEAAEGKKFVPKEDETYWYVKPNNNEVYIYESTFASWYYSDILNVALGNCFTTQQAAIDNKDKIVKRLKALISCAESIRDSVY